MANRSARAVSFTPFKARGILPEGLPEVWRPQGEGAAMVSAAFATIGTSLGRIADRHAALEGERAGLEAGQEGVPQLTSGATIRGEAFNRAAVSAFGWRLETEVSERLADAWQTHGESPKALGSAFEEIKADYVGQGAFDDPRLKELFDKSFDVKAAAYHRRAVTDLENRQAAAARTAARDLLNQQLVEAEWKAFNLPPGEDSDDLLATELASWTKHIDGMVSQGVLTAAQGATEKKAIVKGLTMARVRGVFEQLPTPADQEAFAAGLVEEGKARAGLMGTLELDDVLSLSGRLAGEARRRGADDAAGRAAARTLAADDVASIAASGAGVGDAAEIAARLAPAERERWLADRTAAEALYNAAGDFEVLPADALEERLAALEPTAGAPGYAAADKLYREAAARADRVLKQRRDDPAAAVAPFQSVRAAEAAADPEAPETMGLMIDARLAAQEAVGIPDLARQPLTNDEAFALARTITAALPGPEQVAATRQLVSDVEARYGKHADDVLRQVLAARGVDRELATYGATLLKRMNGGGTAGAGDAAAVDALTEASAADRAMTSAAPSFRQVPNLSQIDRLLSNPELATDFDEKFGAGTARFYLEARRQRQEAFRGITVNPDGTEDFDPDAAAGPAVRGIVPPLSAEERAELRGR